ncbi:hypothetical protein CHH76_02655, partial [Shouchella clausii]
MPRKCIPRVCATSKYVPTVLRTKPTTLQPANESTAVIRATSKSTTVLSATVIPATSKSTAV